ncbi:MAG: ribosome biogenesis GTPase Der [Rickettsiales bacterium]|jgi:GTP-binding protein|nr:ribosome biogenesis GTPase Der [Rickettsiales bacterium]
MFRIALVGKTNVGKSTLFNKLAGRELAITDDGAGVTRDRNEAIGHLGDMTFRIIDTAGWSAGLSSEKLEFKMAKQAELAMTEADLCLFIVDRREGITASDMLLGEKLRRGRTPVVFVANKCEGQGGYFGEEYYKLGLGEPVAISAEHKDGFKFLYGAIVPFYNEFQKNAGKISDESGDEQPLRLAIVGRTNSGKSTLVNRLLGEERVIAGEQAGITRDSITVDWEYKGKKIRLVDTAGLRKKRNISERLEQMSAGESLKSIRFAQVAVMMLDAAAPLDSQELAITSLLAREGRGIVVALNKWDLVNRRNEKKFLNDITATLGSAAPEIKNCPIVPISARDGKNIDKLMGAVFNVFEAWNVRIPTAKLNVWLRSIERENPPPLFRGNPVKLKYITQIKTRPPTFALFANDAERLEQTQYDRFIVNRLRGDFKLENTIIRLRLKKSKNPFGERN